MGRALKETYQLMKINSRQILLFELVYRMITIPVFVWMTNQFIRHALKLAGYSYVTVNNLSSFLLKPGTLLFAIGIGFLAIFFLMVEIGGLIIAYYAAAYHRKINVFQMMAGGLWKTVEELRKKNWKLLFIILIHYVLTNCFFIYRVCIHLKPLNFIIPGIMGEPVTRLLLILALVFFVLIAVPTAFICFGCMIEQKSFADALVRSKEMIRGHVANMAALVFSFHGVVLLVCGLAYLILTVLSAVFAVEFIDKSRELAVMLAASDRIELITLLFGSIMSMTANYGVLTVLYCQYGSQLDREKRWDFDFPSKGWMTRKNFITGMAVLTAFSLVILFDAAGNGFKISDDLFSEIQITAHRGSSSRAPENTLEALEAAIEDLADYAEIDVQETRDGVLILCHDTNLKRVAGADRLVKSMTYEEILKLDVGSSFSAEFQGAKVPALNQALELCKGRLNLNIELKSLGRSSELPEKVAGMIKEYGFEEQCVITSTSFSYLERVKAIDPDIKTGYILSAAYGAYYLEDAMDFISIRAGSVTEKLVELAHENGKEVHVWTVNRKSDLKRMKELGIDNIITDYPVIAREIVYQEENTENLLESIRLMLEQ